MTGQFTVGGRKGKGCKGGNGGDLGWMLGIEVGV